MTRPDFIRFGLIIIAFISALMPAPLCAQVVGAGTRVQAQWQPNSWYPGTITQVEGGRYAITFDDGDKKLCAGEEIAVDRVPGIADVQTGMRLLALWTNARFYPGRVTAISNGVYSISFEDNAQGQTPLNGLRIIGVPAPRSALQPGMAVYAEWTPNSWYHGKIQTISEKGAFVLFDDGDKKECAPSQVAADRIPAAGEIALGSKVLAQWSDGRFYPGTIAAISAGTYQVNFDDGDKGQASIGQLRLR
jgi:hypothetical protein